MKKFSSLVVGLLLFFAVSVQAQVLFEGYYKITQFNKHIGFAVVRQEVDKKTKNFITTSFYRLGKNGFDMSESIHAVSDKDINPISYSYIAVEEKKSVTIDANLKGNKIIGFMTENGKKQKLDKKILSGSFFSSGLYYKMLSSKDGLKADTHYGFKAIAEEQATALDGSTTVDKKLITQGSLQLLKATTDFAGSKYETLLTEKGEIISTNTPATGISTELVKDSAVALEGVKVSGGTLEKLFGDIPAGKTNVYFGK